MNVGIIIKQKFDDYPLIIVRIAITNTSAIQFHNG